MAPGISPKVGVELATLVGGWVCSTTPALSKVVPLFDQLFIHPLYNVPGQSVCNWVLPCLPSMFMACFIFLKNQKQRGTRAGGLSHIPTLTCIRGRASTEGAITSLLSFTSYMQDHKIVYPSVWRLEWGCIPTTLATSAVLRTGALIKYAKQDIYW